MGTGKGWGFTDEVEFKQLDEVEQFIFTVTPAFIYPFFVVGDLQMWI